MAHEILGDRFFQTRATAAWHGIMREGVDTSRDYSANEALDLIGRIDVRKVPLFGPTRQSTGKPIETPYFGIVRAPIPEDNQPRWFGTVSSDYVLVSTDTVVNLWDEHVRRPVQTAMHLRDGKFFVISSKLDGFSVRGEDVENYVMLGNWMDGANASTAHVSSVTPVCMNTWRMAGSRAVETHRFVHDQHVEHRMGEWFKQIIARAEGKLTEAQQAMDLLASYRLTRENVLDTVKTVLTAAYPYPKMPVHDPLAPPEYNTDQQRKYEADMKTADSRRVTATDLFRGSGTGMATEARKGTLWGLYQSVVEVEDYRKGSSGAGLAASVLFGDRAQAKDRALVAALSIAQN